MDRSPFALPWIAMGSLLAIVAGLVMVVSPAVADAQDGSTASLTLQVSPPSAEQSFRTAAVFLDPGDSGCNYWVEVVDPLGQFQQARPKLVDVVGDVVARTGVNISLASVAE